MMEFIAEAATNHGGSVDEAAKMIEAAAKAGADTVKFQHVDPDHFPPGPQRDWYRKVRFSIDQWWEIQDECDLHGVKLLITPQTVGDFKDLLELEVKEVKISSDNWDNTLLLSEIAKWDVSVIASTGMGIPRAYSPIWSNNPVTLLLCTSEYPCPPDRVKLKRYQQIHGACPRWGLSDHTMGSIAACMAVALGATIFEKHFMLEGQSGPDAGLWCCTPDQLAKYIADVKTAEVML